MLLQQSWAVLRSVLFAGGGALLLSACGALNSTGERTELRWPDGDYASVMLGEDSGADPRGSGRAGAGGGAQNPLGISLRRTNPSKDAGRAIDEAPPVMGATTNGTPSPSGRFGALKPGLEIRVAVLVTGKKEVDEPAVRIADDGTLKLPLIGAVDVTGLTLNDLGERLKTRYRDFFVEPEVVVDFVVDAKSGAHPWGSVTVLGRVQSPGRVPLPATRDLTVIGAIQAAGGLGPSARDSSVRVTRRLPDGGTEIKDVDIRSVGARGEVDEDMRLTDGDVVYVPEKMF